MRASSGGTLNVNGGGSSNGAGSAVAFNGGTFNLNQGSNITGAGTTRVTAGIVTLAADTINATNLAISGGTVTGPGALQVSGNLTWTGGTHSGSGTTTVASGATLQLDTSNTKTFATRNLTNNGTATWTGGTIAASDGAKFVNNGSLTVTGNVTFDISNTGTPATFTNNGTLNVQPAAGVATQSANGFTASAAPSSNYAFNGFTAATAVPSTLTVNGNLHTDGPVNQLGGSTATVKGDVTGHGKWSAFDSFLNWITGGLYVPKTVANDTTVSGSSAVLTIDNPAPTTINSKVVITNAAYLVASGAGNLVASGAGNAVTLDGGHLVASGAGNLVAQGGGNFVSTNGSTLVAAGAGNILAAGGTFTANGGNIVAAGAGNLVASGAGNLVAQGDGNLVAQGGGNLVASGGGNLVAGGGGNLVAGGGGNFLSQSASAIVAGGANTFSVLSSGLAGPTGAVAPSSLFTGPIILAENGGNIIGLTGGTFTGNMVAQSGGSLLPGNAGAVGTMTLNGGLDLQAGSLLKMDLLGLMQGTGYDFLNVAGTVAFNGNLLVNMAYALRTLAATDAFTILTATSPITGIIGNLVGNRVFSLNGFGSFKATYGINDNLVLNDFQATALSYPLWQTAWNFASASDKDFSASPAKDGIPNGIKYALGLNPLAQGSGFLPTVSFLNLSGVKYLALTYVRATGANVPTDLSYAVERSTDTGAPGGGWSTTGVVQQSVTPGPDAGYQTVVMRSTTPIGTPGVTQEFLHLKVTKP